METGSKRKTDRRTTYTRNIIKDALLELSAKMTYDKMNVSQICKQAEISRATFYLHYDNLDEVLDAVLDDALLFSEGSNGTVADVLNIIKDGKITKLKDNEAILPACQRIADSDKYHNLFMDSTISDHIIQRIAAHERDKVVPDFMEKTGLKEDEAEMLFRFILYGSFAVNRSLNWEKNERWYRYQQIISKFINSSFKS